MKPLHRPSTPARPRRPANRAPGAGAVLANAAAIAFAAGAATLAAPVRAADGPVRIGFVTTLTTGGAVIGEDMRAAAELALERLGAEAGGRPLEIVFEDDGFKGCATRTSSTSRGRTTRRRWRSARC